MPIRIPDHLPARKTLEAEGVVVMDSSRAARQDIRPLQIGLLNLMPNKERTETQFARLIGSTPLQIDLTLVRVTDHQSKNTSEDYLRSFYSTWEEVRDRKFDGFVVTGAPIANIPFEEVKYWSEMLEIMEWTGPTCTTRCSSAGARRRRCTTSTRRGATACRRRPSACTATSSTGAPNPWLRGFSDSPMVPVSRYNDLARDSLGDDLEILIDNDEIGVCMLRDPNTSAPSTC
jgi:homoserine O-succinyltransferase